jgi:hypothetical protein
MEIVIQNTILVELVGNNFSAGSRYNFQDVPELRGKVVYGVIAHQGGVDYTTSTQGNAIVAATQIRQSLITLTDNRNQQPVQRVPLYDLQPANNGGLIRMFNDIPVDITKSFVEITGTTSFSANDTWAFTFIYR